MQGLNLKVIHETEDGEKIFNDFAIVSDLLNDLHRELDKYTDEEMYTLIKYFLGIVNNVNFIYEEDEQ